MKALSTAKRRTSNWLMREALEQYLQREEEELAFRREASEAWEHYQSTGLHVTQAEMEVWFEKIARGEQADMPKPHR